MKDGPPRGRVFSEAGPVDWDELARRGATWLAAAGVIDPTGPVACVVNSSFEALAIAAAAHSRALDLAILDQSRLTTEVERTLLSAGLSVTGCSTPPAGQGRLVPGRVWLLTSGTTGLPKLVQHSWESLLTAPRQLEPRRWLLPYQPGTYAWYQLVLPSLRFREQDLVVTPYGDIHAAIEAAATHSADAVSSTPTFWRVAQMVADRADLARLPLVQISLGGEVVDQPILDLLRQTYPAARVTHVYAATEVGACIVIHDGLAGFPVALLEGRRPSARLRIQDGRLWVRPLRRAANVPADDGGWIDTGDMVETSGDRVHFKGRIGRPFVNVGGQKAFPSDVEGVLLAHPFVRWCQVEARRAPLVGYLLAAKVVPDPSVELGTLEHILLTHCRTNLPEYAVPRFFNFLDRIPVGANLKSRI